MNVHGDKKSIKHKKGGGGGAAWALIHLDEVRAHGQTSEQAQRQAGSRGAVGCNNSRFEMAFRTLDWGLTRAVVLSDRPPDRGVVPMSSSADHPAPRLRSRPPQVEKEYFAVLTGRSAMQVQRREPMRRNA